MQSPLPNTDIARLIVGGNASEASGNCCRSDRALGVHRNMACTIPGRDGWTGQRVQLKHSHGVRLRGCRNGYSNIRILLYADGVAEASASGCSHARWGRSTLGGACSNRPTRPVVALHLCTCVRHLALDELSAGCRIRNSCAP